MIVENIFFLINSFQYTFLFVYELVENSQRVNDIYKVQNITYYLLPILATSNHHYFFPEDKQNKKIGLVFVFFWVICLVLCVSIIDPSFNYINNTETPLFTLTHYSNALNIVYTVFFFVITVFNSFTHLYFYFHKEKTEEEFPKRALRVSEWMKIAVYTTLMLVTYSFSLVYYISGVPSLSNYHSPNIGINFQAITYTLFLLRGYKKKALPISFIVFNVCLSVFGYTNILFELSNHHLNYELLHHCHSMFPKESNGQTLVFMNRFFLSTKDGSDFSAEFIGRTCALYKDDYYFQMIKTVIFFILNLETTFFLKKENSAVTD